MKKTVLLLTLCILGASAGFAQSQKWISFGPAYGLSMEGDSGLDTLSNNVGLNIDAFYTINRSSWGLFANIFLSYPFLFYFEDLKINNTFGFFAETTIGAATHKALTKDVEFYAGLGLHLLSRNYKGNYQSGFRDDISFSNLNIGLGVDVKLNLLYSRNLFFNVGAQLTTDFFSYDFVREGWLGYYSSFGFRPYLGIGFNI